MSRLDQHVSSVQNRLATEIFIHALAKTFLISAGIILLGIGVEKIVDWYFPQPQWWIAGILLLAAVTALIIAWRRRPDQFSAAAAIDQKLGLQEKISTALYARQSSDPFAVAAVRDAEKTAGDVVLNLGQRFPLSFPKLTYAVLAVAGLAWLLAATITPLDLFGHAEAKRKQAVVQQVAEQSKKQLEDALAQVNAAPPSIADDEKIKLAKQDLVAQLAKPGGDPAQSARSAMKALQDVEQAAEQQIKSNVQFAQAKADEKMWKQIGEQPITDAGPVNDVRKELNNGKFTQAIDDLSKVVNNFDKMNKDDQAKAAEQMKQMSQQLQQLANQTPGQQQQVQQQLQQLGLNQQQAQQAQQLLQQAANGDKQAQQQLQQMAKQAMTQMNNGQGPNALQKQQLQQMMQQMQAGANNQAQAQQLAQAAQQMAQSMQQQAAQHGQSGQQQAQQAQQGGQKGQQGQQANGKNPQQGQGQQGQQGQQAQAQQAGGQQQGMSSAMQQMQAQLQQMQASASDAQQIAAAQQAAQNGMDGGNGDASGGQGPGGQDPGANPGPGQNGPQIGGPRGQGQGGQGGRGFGTLGTKAEAPYTVKPEFSPSQDNETGRLLATSYVKAGSIKGESKAQLKDIAASAIKDPTDEIDQDRISRQAQSAVRKYFSSMQDDASSNTTQPSN